MALTAKEVVRRFPVGRRVETTPEYDEALGGTPRRRTGVVVGYTRDKLLPRVRLDGRKSPYNFHPSFLRALRAGAKRRP